MAVTVTISRAGSGHTETVTTTQEFCVATLSGTYVTGGFTLNPFAIVGGLGTSPMAGSKVIATQWQSPTAYTYVSSVSGQVMTTKIFSAPGTELANGTAVPDATVPVIITKSKI